MISTDSDHFALLRWLLRLTGAVVVLHAALILFWASCYRRLCVSSWASALYFLGQQLSHATVGYGDVVYRQTGECWGRLRASSSC